MYYISYQRLQNSDFQGQFLVLRKNESSTAYRSQNVVTENNSENDGVYLCIFLKWILWHSSPQYSANLQFPHFLKL